MVATVTVVAGCSTPREQQAESGAAEVGEIIVTGSRIEAPARRARAPAPVQAERPSAGPERASAGSSQAVQADELLARRLATVPETYAAGGVDARTAASRVRNVRPLARVQPGEEVWIIQVGQPEEPAAARDDVAPGSGAMLARVPAPDGEPREVPLPLEHTAVKAQVHGYVGTVDVTQEFKNPYGEKIEAVYLFPLPEQAAVNEFVMTVGERKIRGILREREEALRIYEDARAQGYRASLLVQHRPNVFEQKVANIEPGHRIDVSIRYFHTLAYEDGWYSFVFPTVVGPRYNPPGSTDALAALPRNDVSRAGPAVRYLRPAERSAHDIDIEVQVDAGVAIEELAASHPVRTVREGANAAHVRLAGESTLPNRDFVLRFRVAGNTIKSNLLTYKDPATGAGYFTMMVYPPHDLARVERRPIEMVFVVDTSGSMAGRPLEQAGEAIAAALDRLAPIDTFQIMSFSDTVASFAAAPVAATAANVAEARHYVRRIASGGGTQMIHGIRAALGFAPDPERARYVTFLTDGYIGNEAEILAHVQQAIGATRIFSFGVGNSVNRYLLDGLAREGRGAAAYLGLEDSADAVMGFYFDRISRPALTQLSIDWSGMRVSDVYPARLPDLFVGRPVVVTGRFSGEPREVSVRGSVGNEAAVLPVAAAAPSTERQALRSVWARMKIADLAARQLASNDGGVQLARVIRDTALEHGLLSQYTSFIAVDASERTAGRYGTTVFQAVPVPDGVRYDTTVAEQ